MFYEWYIDKVSLFSVKHLMESRLVKQPLIQNSVKILLVTWTLSEETVITFENFSCKGCKVLPTSADNTLLDLHKSSDHTQPYSIIAKNVPK